VKRKNTIIVLFMLLAACSAGCIQLPSGSPEPKKGGSGGGALNERLASVSEKVLEKLSKDPGASVCVLNFSVSGLESVRGEFFSKQLALMLARTASRSGADIKVLSQPEFFDRMKKGGYSPFELIEPGNLVQMMKAVD
jgi:hypothetical protein